MWVQDWVVEMVRGGDLPYPALGEAERSEASPGLDTAGAAAAPGLGPRGNGNGGLQSVMIG